LSVIPGGQSGQVVVPMLWRQLVALGSLLVADATSVLKHQVAALKAASDIRSVQEDGRKAFAKCLDSFDDHKPVVATFMDSAYLEFAKPWAQRMSSMGYENAAFFALDDKSATELRGLFGGTKKCVIPYVMEQDVGGKIPPLVGLAKFDAMELFIEKDRVGFITEADVFWFKDPKAYLDGVKAPLVGAGRPKGSVGPLGLNIGWLRVLPDKRLKEFVKDVNALWLSKLEKNTEDGGKVLEDQNLFNQQLQKKIGEDPSFWKAMDPEAFALHGWNGWELKSNKSCDQLSVAHLTDFERPLKVSKLRKMYEGTLTCKDFIIKQHK